MRVTSKQLRCSSKPVVCCESSGRQVRFLCSTANLAKGQERSGGLSEACDTRKTPRVHHETPTHAEIREALENHKGYRSRKAKGACEVVSLPIGKQYGSIRVAGKSMPLHRAVYVLAQPPGTAWPEAVHHECRVKECVLLAHLKGLSNAAHRRAHKGEKHGHGRRDEIAIVDSILGSGPPYCLTLDEASEATGATSGDLNRLLTGGVMLAVRLRGQWVFPRSEVRALLWDRVKHQRQAFEAMGAFVAKRLLAAKAGAQ